jgi:hypothetical protein
MAHDHPYYCRRCLANKPFHHKHESLLAVFAEQNIKSIDHLGILCLTESPDNEKMWLEYADNNRGFVLAFETSHPPFELLRASGTFGKVEYSDEPFGTLLGALEREGASGLFRKRNKYAFEAEWRSIRLLKRLEDNGGGVFLPRSIRRASAASLFASLAQSNRNWES